MNTAHLLAVDHTVESKEVGRWISASTAAAWVRMQAVTDEGENLSCDGRCENPRGIQGAVIVSCTLVGSSTAPLLMAVRMSAEE